MAAKTIELFVNETTEGRTQLTKVVNFTGFLNIKRADLKTTLHAADTAETGALPFQWKIEKIVINNKTFFPSGRLSSDNKVHDSKGSQFQQSVLKVNDVNTVSFHWLAPLGAGVTSPHGAVTAVLEVIGDSVPFAEDLQFDPRNVEDELSRFTKNATLPSALLIIGIILVLILVAFILVKVMPAITAAQELKQTFK